MFGLYFGTAVCGRKNKPNAKNDFSGLDSHVPTSINLNYQKYKNIENFFITHCWLIIFTDCFGFGRHDCKHRSYSVLIITSLELSVFFILNPKRRRWPRASIKVCNKAKINVILITRPIILMYRLSRLWILKHGCRFINAFSCSNAIFWIVRFN